MFSFLNSFVIVFISRPVCVNVAHFVRPCFLSEQFYWRNKNDLSTMETNFNNMRKKLTKF
jgi:hypothetical protein